MTYAEAAALARSKAEAGYGHAAAGARAGLGRASAFASAHRSQLLVGGGVLLAAATIATMVGRARAASVGKKVVDQIKTVLGTPYIWGGKSPDKGFDCSGVVVWALQQLGLEPKNFDKTAAELHKSSSLVLVPQPGDLAFYGSLFGGVSHVMVYMGDGKVVGASGGGSSTTSAAKAREQNAMVKILPVDYRSDFRGYGRLPYKAPSEMTAVGTRFLGAC